MYCRNCGKELNENSRFCPACGTEVRQTHSANEQFVNTMETETMEMPPFDNEDDLTSISTKGHTSSASSRRTAVGVGKTKTVKIIAGIAIAAVVIGGGVFAYHTLHNTPARQVADKDTSSTAKKSLDNASKSVKTPSKDSVNDKASKSNSTDEKKAAEPATKPAAEPAADSGANSANGAISSGGTPNTSWQDTYVSFLKEKEEYYASTFFNPDHYTIIDINNDGLPEVVIDYGVAAYGASVCTYNASKGEITELQLGHTAINYIKDENLLRYSGGGMDSYYDQVYSIQNGAFVLKFDGQYGAPDNTQVQIDESGMPVYVYNVNGQRVSSEEEYNSLLNKVFNVNSAQYTYDLPGYTYDEVVAEIMN